MFCFPVTIEGGRYFLNASVSATNIALCTSVFVDEVTGTAPEIRQVVRGFFTASGARTIIHSALKDGEIVDDTDVVVAGHRYAFVASYTTASVHRFGIGTNQSFTALGSVTLSKPQIERGLFPTPYIENTSTSDTVIVGVREDQPRFDYPVSGGAPSLLIEPQATNIVTHSEGITLAIKQGTGVVTSAPTEVSPSGS